MPTVRFTDYYLTVVFGAFDRMYCAGWRFTQFAVAGRESLTRAARPTCCFWGFSGGWSCETGAKNV